MMERGVTPHLPFFFSSLSSDSKSRIFIIFVFVFILAITLITRFYFPIALLPS